MRFLQRALMLSVLLLPVLAGCKPEDDIRLETVTHEDREPIRLRVAKLDHGDSVWFVRVDGPVALMKEHQPDFDAFVRSWRFDDKKDEPTWTEPKGWKKDPAMPGRFASFRIASKPKELEVKVTQMTAKGFAMMPNMHRWQKQVHVPLSEAVADNERYIKRENVAGLGVIEWVDMTGLGVHTVSNPKDAAAGDHKGMVQGFEMNKPRIPFKYTMPANWVKQPPGEFALETYRVGEGKKSVEVTITPLSGPLAANVPENINRWRKQAKLDPLPAKELEKTVSRLKVAGIDSFYADIANPDVDSHILGVMVPLTKRSCWFIKMTGPVDVVNQHKNAFETFVQSFKKDAR